MTFLRDVKCFQRNGVHKAELLNLNKDADNSDITTTPTDSSHSTQMPFECHQWVKRLGKMFPGSGASLKEELVIILPSGENRTPQKLGRFSSPPAPAESKIPPQLTQGQYLPTSTSPSSSSSSSPNSRQSRSILKSNRVHSKAVVRNLSLNGEATNTKDMVHMLRLLMMPDSSLRVNAAVKTDTETSRVNLESKEGGREDGGDNGKIRADKNFYKPKTTKMSPPSGQVDTSFYTIPSTGTFRDTRKRHVPTRKNSPPDLDTKTKKNDSWGRLSQDMKNEHFSSIGADESTSSAMKQVDILPSTGTFRDASKRHVRTRSEPNQEWHVEPRECGRNPLMRSMVLNPGIGTFRVADDMPILTRPLRQAYQELGAFCMQQQQQQPASKGELVVDWGDQGTDLEEDEYDQVQQHENFITFVKQNSSKRVSDITMEDFDDDDLELGMEPNSSSTDKTSCDTLHSTPSSDTLHSIPEQHNNLDSPDECERGEIDKNFLDDGDAEMDEDEQQAAPPTDRER